MSDFIGEATVLDSDDAVFSAANSEFLIKKYAAFYNNLVKSLRQVVGTIKASPLSESDFISENGSSWVLCDGQDITGTDLATLKGITTAPDFITEYSWMTQASDQLDVMSTSEDDVAPHFHYLLQSQTQANGAQYYGSGAIGRYLSNRPRQGGDNPYYYGNTDPADICTTSIDGDSESYPPTVKVNFFIKVNND